MSSKSLQIAQQAIGVLAHGKQKGARARTAVPARAPSLRRLVALEERPGILEEDLVHHCLAETGDHPGVEVLRLLAAVKPRGDVAAEGERVLPAQVEEVLDVGGELVERGLAGLILHPRTPCKCRRDRGSGQC